MAITIHSKSGQILFCDFSQGFKKPEMVKSGRPVIVLTGPIQGRANLITVVPLSTVEPKPLLPYHYKIPRQSLPMLSVFQNKESWVKGDMLYTVGFHRLELIRLGKKGPNGKRAYYTNRLGREQMNQIYQCVLFGLKLGYLGKYL